MVNFISVFIAICIAIFSSFINIVIGLFFAWLSATYIYNPLFYVVLFITIVYTLYDWIFVFNDTRTKIYKYINHEEV